jgi:predicted metal-dependent HD superfamily phosphohydrolase
MDAQELVVGRWRNLAARHRWPQTAAQAVLDELLAAYRQPLRHYHNVGHVASLLRLLDENGHGVTDRTAVELAILFHDAIYDPTRHDNEQASADLAGERLGALGFGGKLIEKVKTYILATQHGQTASTTGDADLTLLLDLDLSILGAASAEYRVYAQAIRHEYGHVTAELYRLGRRRVLEGFLARDRIYRTDRLHALWDARARANMAEEITNKLT